MKSLERHREVTAVGQGGRGQGGAGQSGAGTDQCGGRGGQQGARVAEPWRYRDQTTTNKGAESCENSWVRAPTPT